MKNTCKLLAAVAVSAFIAVSSSAFAVETTTTTTTTSTVKTVHHKHHHHHMAHHQAMHHGKTACKQDKHGKCLHFFSAMGRGDNAWMGTHTEWQNTTHD